MIRQNSNIGMTFQIPLTQKIKDDVALIVAVWHGTQLPNEPEI
jgi:hypothetical protein